MAKKDKLEDIEEEDIDDDSLCPICGTLLRPNGDCPICDAEEEYDRDDERDEDYDDE